MNRSIKNAPVLHTYNARALIYIVILISVISSYLYMYDDAIVLFIS